MYAPEIVGKRVSYYTKRRAWPCERPAVTYNGQEFAQLSLLKELRMAPMECVSELIKKMSEVGETLTLSEQVSLSYDEVQQLGLEVLLAVSQLRHLVRPSPLKRLAEGKQTCTLSSELSAFALCMTVCSHGVCVCTFDFVLFPDYVPRTTEDVMALCEAKDKKEEVRQVNCTRLCVSTISLSISET